MSKSLIVVLAAITCAWAYSGGAPTSTCDDMTPKHGVPSQNSRVPRSPFKVLLSKNEVNAGDELSITILGKPFKGFLLQVRDDSQMPVGQFLVPEDDKYSKAINCHNYTGSAATHKNSDYKNNHTLIWKAPEVGKYAVYATVVESAQKFWVGQTGLNSVITVN